MQLFKNLKARILKSIITWSEMGKQTAQAKEVNWANIEQDTAIPKLHNLVTNVWIAGHLSGNPYICY